MVFTIHNIGYQGIFPGEKLPITGLSRDAFFHPEGMEFYGNISLLKSGIVYSDAITTVSPTYAEVLQAERQKARGYHSRHHYTLEGVGLSRQRILTEFADIFERFDFDTDEPAPPSGRAARKHPAPTKKRRLHQEPGLSAGSGG